MKILQITSMGKPYRCGIGDYTSRLAAVLAENKTFEVKVLAKTGEPGSNVINAGEWSLLNIFKIWSKITAFRPDLVHLQYPGKGLGYFLVLPFLALLLKFKGFKTVLTLHEYEVSSAFRKLSSLWLACLSPYLVFTNAREREKVENILVKHGWGGKKSRTIGLAPNILNRDNRTKLRPGKIKKIATFGLFYPGRKMEEAIRLFGRLEGEDLEFYAIGAYDEAQRSYFESVKREAESACKNKKLEFVLNKDEGFLENFLGEMDLFVLLYADGASFKRTSLISAMSFGAPVISNRGVATPVELTDGENIMLGKDGAEVLEKIKKLIASPELYSRISANSRDFSSRFSWLEIRARHVELYNSMLENR